MEAGTLQKSMEMEMSKCMKESEVGQTRKRKKVDRFLFLPDDILLEILKRVPDAFLRYKAKYVCIRWFNIITNRILLSHSSRILQNLENLKTRLVDIMEKEEGLQVKEQDLDVPHKGIIRSWCNEFLLISDPNKRNSLYVYNLITKKGSYLPQCEVSYGGYYHCERAVALSFDKFTGLYKVCHLFIDFQTIECQFFILRRDENHAVTRTFSKWKKIQVPYKNERPHTWDDPVTVQGRYLNWMIFYSNNLVSVDMVKEEIRIISLPGSGDEEEYRYAIFEMGGFLALLNRISQDKTEIWLLKDFERVKREKVLSVSDINWYFDRSPGKVFTYGMYGVIRKRYMMFKSYSGMFCHDLKSGQEQELDIDIQYTNLRSDEYCVVQSLAPCFK